MKKPVVARLLIAGICLILAAGGCATSPGGRRISDTGEVVYTEKPLSVATTLRFEDVPIPAGFNNIRDQSFIFQDGATRVGFVRYAGRANANQVMHFFKTQMALYNWNLLNIVEYGNTTMNFNKANESCVVIVEPLATKTIIGITISPKTGTINTGLGFKRERDRF